MYQKQTYRIAGIVLAAVALLSMASCLKVETFNGNGNADTPVLFGLYSPRTVSRADAGSYVEGNLLPAGTSFGVFAFYQPGVVGSSTGRWSSGGWSPNYMFNQEVEFDGADYHYSPLHYWPSNEENTITFWAYYPYGIYSPDNSGALKFYESDGTTPYSSSSTGLPVVKYTVPTNPNNQYDVLLDTLANTDRTYATCTPTPGTVHLVFRHALSLVQFNISTDNGSVPEGSVVNITALRLTGINTSGTCTNPAASIKREADAANYWTSVSDSTTIVLPPGTTSDSKLILMPQTLMQDGVTGHAAAKLTITFNISYPATDDPNEMVSPSGNEVTAYLWSDVATTPYGVKRWLPGRRYVYNISAGLEEIEFSEVFTEIWTTQAEIGL